MTTKPTGVPEAVLAIEEQLCAPGGAFELEEAEVLGETMLVFKNRVRALPELLRNSVAFGDKEYLIFTDGTTERRITFAQHERMVASTAKVFAERYGVGKGDRVAILGANAPEWIVSFWATIALGGIAVGLNGWSMRPELEYFIEDCEPKLLVADRKRLARFEGDDPGVPVAVMEDDFAAMTTAYPDAELPTVDIAEDDPAVILYTSGTTGRPKGALASHRNIAAFLSMAFWQGLRTMMAVPPPPDAAPSVQFMTSPLFHVSGMHAAAVTYLAGATTSVWWQGRFDPAGAARVIEQERCTGWSITETVLHRFVNHPEISAGVYDLSAVRSVGGGGSPISPALQRRTREVFPNAAASMGLGYGLTECGALATSNSGQELIDFPTAAGRPLPTVQVEIHDPATLERLADGEEGEVWIKSPGVMLEYWRKPEATAQTLTEQRWLRTGDIGWFEGGRLYLASRRKDLILRGGENVYPAEIENRIAEHVGVSEVAVVGVPDPEYGQAVKAIVVPKAGQPVEAEELVEFCTAALAYYKVPTEWEVRSEPLPRNASGKVLKDALLGAEQRFVEE